jgi:hypothetical protein
VIGCFFRERDIHFPKEKPAITLLAGASCIAGLGVQAWTASVKAHSRLPAGRKRCLSREKGGNPTGST